MLKASMVNVQQNITTQINIGTVQGNYFQHVENVNIGSPTKEEPPAKGEGRKKEPLFADVGTQQKEAKRFVAFLKKEGIDKMVLDCKDGNSVNRAFVAYYRYLSKKHKLPVQPNAAACYRFLKDDCNRTFSVGDKSYISFIRDMITDIPDGDLGNMLNKLKEYLA